MTYLETLVRILPRQRRAFHAQRRLGYLTLITGLVIACLETGLILFADPRWLALYMLGTIIGAIIMLFGGYRLTRAEILIAENEALAAAVMVCRQEIREKNAVKSHA